MNAMKYVFIDESGNPNLNTEIESVGKYYVLTAIIVDAEKVEEENGKAINVITKHFQTGEGKSIKIGKNFKRRLRICKDITQLDFHFYSWIFDKTQIRKDSGFQYQESFIKNLNKRIYSQLFAAYPNIRIYSDEQKDKTFLESFKAYLTKEINETFFDTRELKFVDDKEYPFIQIADIVSGTLSKIFNKKKAQSEIYELVKILEKKSLGIDEWPPKYFHVQNMTFNSDSDPKISYPAIRRAEIFLEKNEGNYESLVQAQVITLRYLLYYFKMIDCTKYIKTQELIDHLDCYLPTHEKPYTNFRLDIIAKLRDSNVIIASNSEGYKIPNNINDMYNFANKANGVVIPMLKRVRNARMQLLLTSNNEVDILDDIRYTKLKELLYVIDSLIPPESEDKD